MSSALSAIAAISDFCRRKRDAGRNGNQRHDHGQKAKGDEAAVECSFHGVRVPQLKSPNKNCSPALRH